MKKFLIGFIVFALILFIFPAVASANPGVELYDIGDSTAEWTTEEVRFGGYSAKLSMRGGWWNSPKNNAEVQIHIIGNPKISDIDSWSYWTISPDSYTVPIELNIDTTGDGQINKVLYMTVVGKTPEGWFKVNQDTGHWWYGVGSPDNWAELQSWVNAHYPDATLIRVDLGYGPLGSNQAIDAYVDDFMLNDDITYPVEPKPSAPSAPAVEEEEEEEVKPKPKPWERTDIGYYDKTDTGFTTMFYSRFFRRPPDQAGLDSWVAWLESGAITGADLAKGFIFGEECQAKISGYTDSEFITFLYKVLFNREPGTDGFDAWLARMSAGMTREEVVDRFVHGEEFVNLCILFGIIPYEGYIDITGQP